MKTKYGYLGPKGTHCEEALSVYLGAKKAETGPYPGVEQVLTAVRDGEISHGLVPLENSIEGTVNLALDLIASDQELHIVGEVILPIRHNLLVKPGGQKEDLSLVVSHPQALAQCREYLNRQMPGVPVREVNSTAEAARLAAEADGRMAAIGNKRAADYYGLEIIAADIQDCKENRTRFVVISKKESPVPGPAKTSLVLSITDRPGGLYQILREFALVNINLTKIESRPAKRNFGDYLFFIDLIGHQKDPVVKKCLAAIRDMTASFRILGSYPSWGTGGGSKSTAGLPPPRMSVREIRQDIDIIDYQIVELLEKRTHLVSLVGTLKNGWTTVRDKDRELEILRRVRENALQRDVDPELMEKIYQILFDHFVKLQEKQKR